MIAELNNLLRLLGPRKMIRNARTMKRARSCIRGYGTTVAYWALMRVGFIDALEGGSAVPVADFCAEHDLDEEILADLCRYLGRLGHMRESADRISFTPKGQSFWSEVNGVLNIFGAYEPFLSSLESFLRKETPKESKHRRDKMVALGFRETGANVTFAAMARIMRQKGFRSMVELGCGNIDLTLHVSRALPDLRAVGIDNDDWFLDEARATIAREGLSDRVSVLKHDLFDLEPSAHDFAPYELITAIDLFHGYFYEGRERVLELFVAMRRTFPGKKFLVSEMCLADESRMARIAYPMVEHELFHGLTGQKTFAAGELEGLLREAGFTILEEWPVRNLAARLFILFES